MFAETIYYNNRQDELIKEAENYRLIQSLQEKASSNLIARLFALLSLI